MTAPDAALRLSDFDYVLPADRIAQHPPTVRSASRLLQVRPGPAGPQLSDRWISELPGLLQPGDLLVLNDTRVIKARLFGHKDTGGRVELLIERIEEECRAVAMLRSSKPVRPGTRIALDGGAQATVQSREGAFCQIETDRPILPLLDAVGSLPLPPYIDHTPAADDDQRYQTVYAAHPGAVAAPTAGLHFDEALLAALDQAGITRTFVTLHVGAGTFLPVREEDPNRHVMHAERYHVPQAAADAVAATRARGGRVVAVGTTSLRTLESAMQADGQLRTGWDETRLFIRPGHRFRAVDVLLTNFHLPRSTLMMLVSAFAGLDTIRRAYAHAIAGPYRFFSYGDAMLLERTSDAV